MPSLSLGLGLHKNRIFAAGGGGAPFSPTDLSGLSLWLKANAGVTTSAETFVSEIILTGSGTTTSDGTYTRASGGLTGFTGPNGNTIGNSSGEEFKLYDSTFGGDTYLLNITSSGITYITDIETGGDLPVPTSSVSLSNTGNLFVTTWADQSGNGRNASAVDVSSYPTFNSSDLNNRPTISLSSVAGGTNKSFQISGNPMGASGSTAFVVNYVDPNVFSVDGENGDGNGALLGNFGSAENGSHWPYGIGTSSVYDSFATDTRKDDLGLPTGITSWNIYSVYSQNNDWKLFCNGTEFYSDTSNVYSNAIANSTSLYIGMQNNAGTDQIFKGKIAEVVFYNRVLTTQERQQVEAYLNTKYAIY